MPATIPTPATKRLAEVIRKIALDGCDDSAELLRCFARLLEGKDLDKAMGAPGDWGYGTPIGDAVHALLKEPSLPPRLFVPDAKNEG